MNKELQKIIEKYIEFNAYLNGININEFNKFSRSALIEFAKELRQQTHFRYIPSEINEIINEKKLEEYPQLLGVHHYPELKELDCISDEDKVILDNYLNDIGCRKYIHKTSVAWRNISKKWNSTTQDKIFKFLEDRGIVERYYNIRLCCNDEVFSQTVINNYLCYFKLKASGELYDNYDKYESLIESIGYDSEGTCEECGEEYEITKEIIEKVIQDTGRHIYRIIKERDKTYDNK
jgi:hypothetical protein